MIMLKGIEKTYCGKEIKTKVLKGVDLSISKGEFVCIFGESGILLCNIYYKVGI